MNVNHCKSVGKKICSKHLPNENMRKRQFVSITAGFLLALTSCSEQDDKIAGTSPTSDEEMVRVTGYIKEEVKVAETGNTDIPQHWTATRTTFDNTFLKDKLLLFRWSDGDKVYLKTGESSTASFTEPAGKKSYATFWFKKSALKGDNVPVQYVGTESQQYGKVKIASEQIQLLPNNADHIGKSGDCATAEIKRNTRNNYIFTLHHKAAFLCFMPFSPKGTYTKLYGITVSADKPLSKEYTLGADGLEKVEEITEAHPNYVYLKTGGENGFEVKTTKAQEANAAIMVIHPQTTALVCVFTVGDKTGKMMNIVKYIPQQSLEANKLYPYGIDLENDYGRWDDHLYYMWDADWIDPKKQIGADYWYGHTVEQPTRNGGSASNYPTSQTDPRYYNTKWTTKASRTAYETMTKETVGYDTRYFLENPFSFDSRVYWPMRGVLQHGGMWITRYSQCKRNAYATIKGDGNKIERYDNMVGRPENDIKKFFFLPALGHYDVGTLGRIGEAGVFWMYNASDESNILDYESRAYFLSFHLSNNRSHMTMGHNQSRRLGLPLLHSYYAKY